MSPSLEIQYLGHAGFRFNGSLSLVIDPFLEGNPKAPFGSREVTGVDWVLATHDHADHWPDVIPIVLANDDGVCAQYELVGLAGEAGVKRLEPVGIGGTVELAKGVRIHGVNAQHSAGIGQAMGFVVEMDGHRIFHMGDTGLFGDMALIGEWLRPTIALVPCGDRFTMGVASAVKALELCGAKTAFPMHYCTFPLIADNGAEFAAAAGHLATIHIPAPGESLVVEA